MNRFKRRKPQMINITFAVAGAPVQLFNVGDSVDGVPPTHWRDGEVIAVFPPGSPPQPSPTGQKNTPDWAHKYTYKVMWYSSSRSPKAWFFYPDANLKLRPTP